MANYEKLGLFYLGRTVNPKTQTVTPDYLLYDSKDLVTHAVCVGMTGSGKTGLCISLLEEAAIDKIPAVIVDPKGDLANLMLLFPDLKPEDFRPWVNEDEAAQKGISADDFAREQAGLWRRGLAEWDMDPARIRMLLDSAEIRIYTPGSNAGLPLSVLRSFDAPPPALVEDTDLFRERISTTTSGLLGLLGIQADPLQSREHILISNILEAAWRAGQGLDLPALIQKIQAPPFQRIGVFEVDAFYPAADRYKLAMMINNLLAAPGFESWLEGDPLDIGSLLYAPSGKPRLAILSIAHLSDAERMFFVTILLNQLLGWMRGQPGTSSLRALFYMDEIFGYFPPVSEPPSKRPLLTLLKQARAFGLGIVLSTQNPVDLDYKGLANAGTWFIGRLQTERDKDRLLEGLSGVGGNIDLKTVSNQLSALKKRVFLMHNVHEDAPVLMNTRWALSYLRGPLTRQQIASLMKDEKEHPAAAPVKPERPAVSVAPSTPISASGQKPSIAPGLSELFFPAGGPPAIAARLVYHPAAAALAQVAIFDNRLGISSITDSAHYLELGGDVLGLLWDKARPVRVKLDALSREAPGGALFLPVPGRAASLFKSAGDDYADFLTRSYQLNLWKSPVFQAVSQPGEPERDFRIRLGQQAREKRDAELDKLRQKYAVKINTLQNQLLLAQQRLQREEEQYKGQMTQTAISMGATILGAILGRKTSQIGRATTSARGASRAYYEKMDIQRARQQVEQAKSRLDDLERQLQAEADRIGVAFDPAAEALQAVIMRPKKKDIAVRWSGLLWLPFWHPETGGAEPGFPAVQS
ncbi:MAG: ATP-binding protein [Candidatus Aminicenantes bacterium RBG_16_63_16]|nr:MAG: ATP-binding protein [Candidatus Aminicenantes bacterium RBG_16_63_16]